MASEASLRIGLIQVLVGEVVRFSIFPHFDLTFTAMCDQPLLGTTRKLALFTHKQLLFHVEMLFKNVLQRLGFDEVVDTLDIFVTRLRNFVQVVFTTHNGLICVINLVQFFHTNLDFVLFIGKLFHVVKNETFTGKQRVFIEEFHNLGMGYRNRVCGRHGCCIYTVCVYIFSTWNL